MTQPMAPEVRTRDSSAVRRVEAEPDAGAIEALKERASERFEGVTSDLGTRVERIGDGIREAGGTAGASLSDAGHNAGQTLRRAGGYLRRTTADSFLQDAGAFMERHPRATLVAGITVGLGAAALIARIVRR